MPDGGDIVDISGLRSEAAKPGQDRDGGRSPAARPWISIYFECCRVYCRVYRNAAGDAYVGWCPKCAGKATVLISADGGETRFFRAK
jgi:hypothetical protein